MFAASFSGGKDSQVLLDLVCRVVPCEDFVVIYSDTGYELPTSLDFYEQIKKFYQEQYPDLKFYTARNQQSVLDYWDKMGPPSRIQRWCCSVMKSAPLSRKLKEIYGEEKQPNAILFDGVRAEESNNRAGRSRIGKNAKHNNIINISPILEWNSTEIYLYLLMWNLPINESYRKGLARVGCVLCPYSSGWSEDLCGRLYPQEVTPFLDKLKSFLTDSKISGIDNYIRLGNWKMRAGGRNIACESNVRFISVAPDFKAIIHAPRENLLTWLKVLGEYRFQEQNGIISGELKYRSNIFIFRLTESDNQPYLFEIDEVGDDIGFLSRIKRVIYKSTYCIHCEVCEVECPTGALSVTPIVSVTQDKCIHCFKCLDFNDKGCISASSITTSDVNILSNNSKNMSAKSGINRYNDGMGLREHWLRSYFNNYETFFDNDQHGLNAKYQIPPFINWLREACILNLENKNISPTGGILSRTYANDPNKVWEIIFINLCANSEVCSWFHSSIAFNRAYTKEDLDILIHESYQQLRDRTLRNPLNSLINTFKESPLTKEMYIMDLTSGSNFMLIRKPYPNISVAAVAYSLYKYAEEQDRHSLTISEFYDENQPTGIYRQFGIDRETFEKKLRTLQEDENRVLTADLNMGLDNINLREDLTSFDIIKFLM